MKQKTKLTDRLLRLIYPTQYTEKIITVGESGETRKLVIKTEYFLHHPSEEILKTSILTTQAPNESYGENDKWMLMGIEISLVSRFWRVNSTFLYNSEGWNS